MIWLLALALLQDELTVKLPAEADCPGTFQARKAYNDLAGRPLRRGDVKLAAGEILCFDGATKITDDQVATLETLPLKVLELFSEGGCNNLTGKFVASVGRMKQLEILYIPTCGADKIPDDVWASLKDLTELRILGLGGRELSNDALAFVSGMKKLESLELWRCKNLTGAGMQHLSKLTSLRHLNIEQNGRIDNEALKHIEPLVNLDTLNLDGARGVTDEGLKHLGGMKKLERLYMSRCSKVSNAGIAHFAGLTELNHLSLNACPQVGDPALEILATLPKLAILNLSETGVSDEGLVLLKRALPKLKVNR